MGTPVICDRGGSATTLGLGRSCIGREKTFGLLMNRKEYLDECAEYLGRLSFEVRAMNAIGHFDINKVCENFLVPILQIVYKCPNLRNQNQISYNFPAVDLGDEVTRLSFQVTSDSGSGKVLETLKKFTAHELDKRFTTLYILVLTEKQGSYGSKLLKDVIAKYPINFDASENIVDMWDLAASFSALDLPEIRSLHSILKSEFEKKDKHLQFRDNLDKFLEFCRSKVEVERNSKKYIPSIFTETHSAKEQMRLFANPMFFYSKVDDRLASINIDVLNRSLAMASLPKLESCLAQAAALPEPSNLDDLQSRMTLQEKAIEDEMSLVGPYSYHHDRYGGKYPVPAVNEPMWSVVRLRVEGGASSIFWQCEKALNSIGLMKKKIFLVTSMAGQGKTNFICDLIENQFRIFEIPSIFVPARELNAYPGPSRIFGFLTNNRYAPKVNALHELLELFNNIAKEMAKPFVIAIDGINEISALDDFNIELKTFLSAIVQYDYIKVIITCRSEFFDSKFASLLQESFSSSIHRVSDLKSEMSEASKDRMLQAYLEHFKINGSLLHKAANFLKNDLLLIRIFCELNEKTDIGQVAEIYKGDLFEKYLLKKFSEFPEYSQRLVLPTLYKLVASMIASKDFTAASLDRMSADEVAIVQSLVAGDVVLRQEVPGDSLSAFGTFVVSFTYDELRDFVIAHYLANSSSMPNIPQLIATLADLKGLPPYEGVFKYLYALARRRGLREIVEACEAEPDFAFHFALNLSLLPADLQNASDLARVNSMLSLSSDERTLQAVAVFLYHQRDKSNLLNISILIDYVSSLDDNEHERFVKTLFSDGRGWNRKHWQERIDELMETVVSRPIEDLANHLDEVLAFFLHAACFANWEHREKVITHIFKIRTIRSIDGCIKIILASKSNRMQYVIMDINDMLASV